jgi:hypothetical protein
MRPILLALVAAVVLLAPDPSGAVVAGRSTSPAAHPWLTSFGACGGTLVTPRRVLTAAHCIGVLPADQIRALRFGGRVRARVARVALHPGFVTRELLPETGRPLAGAPYDVAILELDAPVRGVEPLPPARTSPRPGAAVTVLGRGATSAGRDEHAGRLRSARLAVIADRDCVQRHRAQESQDGVAPGYPLSRLLCAGDPDGRAPFRAACRGDSGSALVRGGELVGVVSWGDDRCGQRGAPSAFADVAAARRFALDERPDWAPVPSDAPAVLGGSATVGGVVTCTAGRWHRAPDRVVYRWRISAVDEHGTIRVEDGRPVATTAHTDDGRYAVRAEDAGRRIECEPVGISAGGVVNAVGSGPATVPAG